jgi:DDE superfamily endonuclease
LDAILILHIHFVSLPPTDAPLASQILDDDNYYYPFFGDCLGALAGTHIPIFVPAKDHARYRNRTGSLSRDVLAVCNFNMQFLHILAGSEGSAPDGQVLQDAQTTRGFLTPEGKYWLGDAGYACTEFVLAPYRGVRYDHLNMQGQTPENGKELFNLRHASLRNVAERIFAVLKRRFKILNIAAEYSADTQTRLIIALTGLTNFLIIHEGVSEEELEEVDRDIQQRERESIIKLTSPTEPESIEMATRRDRIAEAMWEDYCFSNKGTQSIQT